MSSPSSLNWRLLVGIVVLAMAGLGLVMWNGRPVARHPTAAVDITVKDLDGRDVHLADLKGRPVLINFWETFCVPCQYETPELVALHDKYKARGLTIVGISMHDEVPAIRAFVQKYHIPYTVLVGGDRDDLTAAFGVRGYPTTVFVRADGTIADVQLGYLPGAAEKKLQSLF